MKKTILSVERATQNQRNPWVRRKLVGITGAEMEVYAFSFSHRLEGSRMQWRVPSASRRLHKVGEKRDGIPISPLFIVTAHALIVVVSMWASFVEMGESSFIHSCGVFHRIGIQWMRKAAYSCCLLSILSSEKCTVSSWSYMTSGLYMLRQSDS